LPADSALKIAARVVAIADGDLCGGGGGVGGVPVVVETSRRDCVLLTQR
jgi:hypothetical protein